MRFLLMLLPALLVACSSATASPSPTPATIDAGPICGAAINGLRTAQGYLNHEPGPVEFSATGYVTPANVAAFVVILKEACNINFSR